MEQQLQYNIDSEGKVTVSRLITNMCTGKTTVQCVQCTYIIMALYMETKQ